MLFLVLRKILNNKSLIACLLLGSILVVAMISSVPMYTDSISQRMLIKDMESYQRSNPGSYPCVYKVSVNTNRDNAREKTAELYAVLDTMIRGKFMEDLGLPVLAESTYWVLDGIRTENNNPKMPVFDQFGSIDVTAVSGWQDHVKVLYGRLPSEELSPDGEIEAMITEDAQIRYGLRLDTVYRISAPSGAFDGEFLVKTVGICANKEPNDPWWFEKPSSMAESLLIDDAIFRSQIVEKFHTGASITWYAALDYHGMTAAALPEWLATLDSQYAALGKVGGVQEKNISAESMLRAFSLREAQLRLQLMMLQVPLLIMMGFYIVMVANLIVDNDRKEISVYVSRGFSPRQLFASYLMQSAFLAVVSMLAGPFAGMGICKLLGVSDGFLVLVNRLPLGLVFTVDTLFYVLAAAFFLMVMMMIPAVRATRTGIVELLQKRSRKWNAPFWQKQFLDIILIGLSLYGRMSYSRIMALSTAGGDAAATPSFDPMLLIMYVTMILGLGLLFLRIYPLLVRLIFRLGRRIWNPSSYVAFVQVGRIGGREQFIMLFLIMTVAIGLFSANSARTLNTNTEDRVHYLAGADITLQQVWKQRMLEEFTPDGGKKKTVFRPNESIYVEPDYSIISRLPGTLLSTKVFRASQVASGGKSLELMAVDPTTFSQVAWSNKYLMPGNINKYLQILENNKDAVILSSAAAAALRVELGDTIAYQYVHAAHVDSGDIANPSAKEKAVLNGTVYAIVDAWPGIDVMKDDLAAFMIANINYIHLQGSVEPYEVWFAKDPDSAARNADIQVYLNENKIDLKFYADAEELMTQSKTAPMLQGTNGALTMGFVVIMVISLVGFILYWILSIRARVMQFGTLRAIGFTQRNLLGILILEQALISLTALFVGMVIGSMACDLFIPMLKLAFKTANIVPAFRLVYNRGDYLRIYALVSVVLLMGLAMLGGMIARIKMSQAIKLGED